MAAGQGLSDSPSDCFSVNGRWADAPSLTLHRPTIPVRVPRQRVPGRDPRSPHPRPLAGPGCNADRSNGSKPCSTNTGRPPARLAPGWTTVRQRLASSLTPWPSGRPSQDGDRPISKPASIPPRGRDGYSANSKKPDPHRAATSTAPCRPPSLPNCCSAWLAPRPGGRAGLTRRSPLIWGLLSILG